VASAEIDCVEVATGADVDGVADDDRVRDVAAEVD
jgi:hypothetical protein